MLGCALLPRKGSARAQCQQPNLWDCFDPQACKMFCEERREFVVRLFAFDRIVVVCARFHRTSHPAQSLCVLDRLETSLSSTVSHPPSNCDRCQRFMRFSGCLPGVYLLLFARAGALQLQVPAARAAAAAAAAEVAMPVRAFVSNNLFSAGTARAGSRPAANVIRGSWRAAPSRTSAPPHVGGSSKGRCRAFAASSETGFNFNVNSSVGEGSGVYLGSNRGDRRIRNRAVLPARLPPVASLSSSSSSSTPSRSPLPTAAVIPSSPPSRSAGSVASEPGPDLAFDGGEGEGEGEWPIPHPSQPFVARARDGAQYEHDSREAGARRIRAVVSDLDGTLLGPDKLVSARTLEAVRRARAKGIIFVPASGRSRAGMFSCMGELGEDLKRDQAPIVCMNGLAVYGQGDGNRNGGSGEAGNIIYSAVMCSKLALQVVAFWRSHPLAAAAGVSLCGSDGEDIVVERLDDRTRSFKDWREPLPKEVGSWEDAIAGGMILSRLYFWGPTRAAVDAFKVDLGAHLKDHPMELTRGVPEMIEVLPPGTSKAVGLEALLKDLGVSPEEVVALGDMENDIEMLRSVGHGVAMGQASLEVRRAAQYTAPTNELHGVAVALETFCDT